MQIAVLLYDRVTALDAIGPYEILSRVPGVSLVFVASSAGPVRTDTGRLSLVAEASLEEVPAPGLLLVPGSPAAPTAGPVVEWLRAADAARRFAWPRERRAVDDILSIVGGGDAGLLEDVLRVS
jgi:putative intracellular protease/amidase